MSENLIIKLRNLIYGPDHPYTLTKIEIEGHIIAQDIENKKSMVLIKIHNRLWKTTWLNDSEYSIKAPKYTLNSIFTNK